MADRLRHRYRIDGIRYVWVGVDNGEFSLYGDNTGGWNIADPEACADEGVHHPRLSENFGCYCSRCGKSHITLRDGFASDEEYAVVVAKARKEAEKLMGDLGWTDRGYVYDLPESSA